MGLETAFPVLYTKLVKPGILSMERLIECMCYAPRKRFSIPMGEDWCVWDLESEFTVDPEQFLSKGRATPFAGWKLQGQCVKTVCDGVVVYEKRR